MSAAPDNSSWKGNSVKRRKLFSGEAVELTPQMTSVNSSNEEIGERLERASSSKSAEAMEANNFLVNEGSKYTDEDRATQCPEDEGLDTDFKTHSNSVGDATPKRNLRIRTPLKNSVPKAKTGFGNGERYWSSEEKEKLLSILKNDGFDGDIANLAAKLPNQTMDSVRYLINHYEEDRKKHNWEVILDSKIEDLRGMEGSNFDENLALALQFYSLFGTYPDPSLVGGVVYKSIYEQIASLMRGEVPKNQNPATSAKWSQLFLMFKQRILSEPEVPMPEFNRKEGSKIERKKELKERRTTEWSADELEAKEILLSGDVRQIEQLYLSQASLNPF